MLLCGWRIGPEVARTAPPAAARLTAMLLTVMLLTAVLLAVLPRAAAASPGPMDAPVSGEAPAMSPTMTMLGLYGPYPMSRDSSGTSWQPDSTPMGGLHAMGEGWMTMWHGFADFIHDDQGGPRGGSKDFSSSMLMFMGRRALPDGALGFHVMLSADPLMGRSGYPELFQTGETADGVHPLIDRQHPHNLLMEASGSYTVNTSADSAAFVYAGIAGEPALGPPAFMHRFSSSDDPQAPLSHHWLDSTHITYGVLTGGYVWQGMKLEASSFNGREPDQFRYAVELRRFDSYSVRLSVNPTPDLSLQVSSGWLAGPEQLQPGIAVRRTTASASYNRMFSGLQWQTTGAFGRNQPRQGMASNAWLFESEVIVADADSFFGRLAAIPPSSMPPTAGDPCRS